jgi:hypothetical protein
MDRYCEDCPTCPGKCLELKACVQCKQFKSGELHDQKVSFFFLSTENKKLPTLSQLSSSIADPGQFGVDPDPDPRIHASD